MNDDFLVINGGSLKSLNDSGKIGGYLVLFDEVDLAGEVFLKSSDFWLEGKTVLPLLWRHGIDKTIGRRRLTHVEPVIQNEGVWIEGKLPLGSNEYVDAIWDLVQLGAVGLSSGSASHLVEKEFNASKNAHVISSWPITEASLTSTPCQPKSRAVALKSLPVSDFRVPTPEQRAAQIYADLLVMQHELKMSEIANSMHADSIAEEYDYYNALAEIQIAKFEAIRRRVEN